MENGNWRILVLWKTSIGEFFFFLSENSRFLENGNWRILVLWKSRIGEFFFFIREFPFCGNGEFSFCGKRELENSRFVKNQNRRIFFSPFLTQNSRFMENGNWRILVLWKTRIGEFFFFLNPEFSFCRKRELENSRFVENQNRRIFFFLNQEISFCGKRELENSRFVENQNRRIFFFFYLSENSRFVETENSGFVETGNWRILVL